MRLSVVVSVLGALVAMPVPAAASTSGIEPTTPRDATLAATTPGDPPSILLWHQVGGVGIGMTRARVEYTYGRPASSSPLGPEYSLHGGRLYVGYDHSGNVDQIMVATSYYKAAGGFGVGYRIPLGPCHRTGSTCRYTWQGLTYDGVQAWYRSFAWRGAQMEVLVTVDRGIVQSFQIDKLGSAENSTAPSTATTQVIIAAVRATVCASSGCPGAKVSHVRLSKTDPSYATAAIYDPKVGGAAILLRRTGAVWKVVDYGSSQVGCGEAPIKVLNDLGLYCH